MRNNICRLTYILNYSNVRAVSGGDCDDNEINTSQVINDNECLFSGDSESDEELIEPIVANIDDDICSDEDSDDQRYTHMPTDMSWQEAIRYWALSTNQNHKSIEMIMKIIGTKTGHPLPHSARTLLHTNTNKLNIKDIAGGKYWFNGINPCLSSYFRCVYSIRPLTKISNIINFLHYIFICISSRISKKTLRYRSI